MKRGRFLPVTPANEAEVRWLTNQLVAAYEKIVNDRVDQGREVQYLDAFMSVHNFHKAIVLDLAERWGFEGDERRMLLKMAADTFQMAMNEKAGH